MAITITNIVEAFELLFTSLRSKSFSNTLRLHEYNEKELSPLVRTFLLGYFGKSMRAETKASLPGSLSGSGRVDFMIGNVAVELAVRRPDDARAVLSSRVNHTEVKKLLKHQGLGVLILFDFSKSPYSESAIEAFRSWPSLGKGNHKTSAFNVAYFYIKSHRPLQTDYIRKNIRV